MEYLKELITEETSIINLKNDFRVPNNLKETILGNISDSGFRKDEYLKMMYFMNNTWYYFKKETENGGYPFYLINELMGNYLVKSRGLNASDLLIAKTKKEIGLASKNFKKEGYDYYFGDYFQRQYEQQTNQYHNLSINNIENLKILCPNEENGAKLIDDFLNMLAIDIYMLQTDRGQSNIQFAINQETQEVELSYIYDFSNCTNSIQQSGIFLKNCIVKIDDYNIHLLIKKYIQFKDYLLFLIEQGFVHIWNTISTDYHFNKESLAYKQVSDYYKMKEESQKKYLKELIKSSK